MYYIYVLKSHKDNNFYIGCTNNIEQRLKLHNSGKVFSTKSRLPLNLIYSEVFDNKYEAYRMERFYKTAVGKRQLKKKILAGSSNGRTYDSGS